MASPLCESNGQALNSSTPPSIDDAYEVKAYTVRSNPTESSPGSQSSNTSMKRKSPEDQENISPSKSRHHRVLSGTELSPLKILSPPSQAESVASPLASSEDGSGQGSRRPSPVAQRNSPRKMSPEKRFPVKVSNPLDMPQPAAVEEKTQARTVTLEEVLQGNSGLKRAIEIFEDDQNDDSSAMDLAPDGADETAGPDDTMVSTFSTFSAVPDMTMFAKLGQSPTRTQQPPACEPSPRASKSDSSSSNSHNKRESSNTTNLLIDFTEQLRNPQRSPARRMAANDGTPRRQQLSNLIDFDIPPMPTPRSVPSITPRELESLKSNFLSEISSLKASLSGKEAEVHSLKTAVGDAEKRVGESLERLREEQIAREQIDEERRDWEHRGHEMETVLRSVRDEIMHGQKERDELERKLDESEKRREAAEMLHQEAESKMAGMRAGRESAKSSPEKAAAASPGLSTSQEVELAVERVARELHGLYKGKHEAKVTALKKSYEARWQKKIKELESRIDQLTEKNEKLREGRDTTMTKVDPNSSQFGELNAQAAKDNATIKELNADVQRLEAVVVSVQKDNGELRTMLENERIEKGELVQLAEEMMSMQSFVGASQTPAPQRQQQRVPPPVAQTPRMPPSSPQRRQPEAQPAKTPKTDSKNSMGRASGLRAPGTALRPPHERNKSAGGLPRPGGSARSGIMSSIERMGSHRGRGAAD